MNKLQKESVDRKFYQMVLQSTVTEH